MNKILPASKSNDLILFKKTRFWLDYTLLLLEGFPKKLRFTLKDKICGSTLEVLALAIKANQIKPLNQADRQQRLRYQNDLIAEIIILDNLFQIACQQNALTPKQLVSWAKLANELRFITLGWIRSDYERYHQNLPRPTTPALIQSAKKTSFSRTKLGLT